MSGQVIEQLPEGGLRLRILEVDRPFPKQGQPEISQERLEAAGNGVNDTAEHGRARADNGISLASEPWLFLECVRVFPTLHLNLCSLCFCPKYIHIKKPANHLAT